MVRKLFPGTPKWWHLFLNMALLGVMLLLFNTAVASADAPPQFLAKWGTYGSGDGQFSQPYGVAVDASGNVYVTDIANYRIQKFTSGGAFITKWGTYGSGDGQFGYPRGVAVDASGNVYVTDLSNHRIQKFTSGGAFIIKWGTQGSGNGQFYWPSGVAVDASGNVYVADWGYHRIQKFTSGGVFITKWGGYGNGNGQFSEPQGVAVDASGNVYVADYSNHRIQKFTSGGDFITRWGGYGSGDGYFILPHGVAVDASGNVYVADTSNHRIQKFTSGGAFVTKWGTQGSGDGQFYYPHSVAVNASGNVYVTDLGNHRIQVFGYDTTPPDTIAPTTMATPSPGPNVNGWNNTNVAVALSAADNPGGSGVKEIRYLVDGGAEQVVAGASATVTLATEGQHTLTYWAVDNAGNAEAAKSLAVNIDKTKPTITASATANGSPYTSGSWTNQTVTVKFACGDTGGSGLAGSCPADQVFSAEGTFTSNAATIADKAGNTSDPANTFSIKVDKTAPTTTIQLAGTAGNNGWYISSVTVTLTATDPTPGSGVKEIHYAIDGVETVVAGANATVVITTDGVHTFEYWAVDYAGNIEVQVQPPPIQIDSTPATTTVTPVGTSGAGGYYTSGVGITFSGADFGGGGGGGGSGSGISAIYYTLNGGPATMISGDTATINLVTDGTYTIEAWVVDKAGNIGPHKRITIMIDKTPPTLTKNLSGTKGNDPWWVSNVTVTLTASDATSGINKVEYSFDGTSWTTYTGPFAISTAGRTTLYHRATDNAGNVFVLPSQTISVDTIAPTISATATKADATPYTSGTWTNQTVTVKFTCGDTGGSGLSGSCPADQVFSAEGTFTSNAATIADNAGNTSDPANTFSVKIDKTTPKATPTQSPAANPAGWNKDNVTVTWNWSDNGGSGIDTANCTATSTSSGEGGITLNASCKDLAGNMGNASYAVKVDKTTPIVTITSPANGAQFIQSETVLASWSVSDTPSGLTATSATTPNGQPIDTAVAGAKTFTVVSTDLAGNVTSITNTYTVLSPAQAIQVLVTTVKGFNLPKGTETSLTSKLNAAFASLQKGQDNAAVNQLNAFVNEFNAQRGKALTNEQANTLIQITQKIIAGITG